MRILDNCDPLWLQWARKLQALAQNGLTYTENGYDLDRYRQIRLIALEMMAKGFESSLTAKWATKRRRWIHAASSFGRISCC